ncbi:MAG: DUF4365 domain-containing protein [Streptosporangiaceae bacterium]
MTCSWRCALGCEWCLDQNNHQGWYGESFIRALAAAAGLQISKVEPDCTGIDFMIRATRQIDGDFPAVMVQVKSWSVPVERSGGWRYDRLTQKRFNALAGRNRRFPTFLFLVIVPSETTLYASADEAALRLSRAAYWLSLADYEQIPDAACDRRVPVVVPRQNLLTVQTLVALCEGRELPGRRAS